MQWPWICLTECAKKLIRLDKEAKEGHCLVAWARVTKEKEMGEGGVVVMKALGMDVRVR
jgi:hypothetical protein